MIKAAKDHIDSHCEALLAQGLAETLDVCTLAYLHEILTGDGDTMTTECGIRKKSSDKPRPLHEVIRLRRGTDGNQLINQNEQQISAATPLQIAETAEWLTQRIFSDAWRVLDDVADREARGETVHDLWKEAMFAQSVRRPGARNPTA